MSVGEYDGRKFCGMAAGLGWCLVGGGYCRAVCVKVRMTKCGVERERCLVAEVAALEPALIARLSEAQGGLHCSASTKHTAPQAIDISRDHLRVCILAGCMLIA